MGIATFERDRHIIPYLNKPLKANSGLDQLGLNLTSERIYDFLLPGLNNVTGRIRYYSFYSWFFDWYSKEVSILSSKEQTKYLRRAEFLLALISISNNTVGVSGITRAREVYESSQNLIDLKDGTLEHLGTTEGSYWKYSTGVFGQYYANSLKVIGIIREQGDASGVYVRTEFEIENQVTGLMLAEAFQQSIGEEPMSLFVECVQSSTVTKDELSILGEPFNMIDLQPNASEHQLLWKLLVGEDSIITGLNTYYRRNTIYQLLKEIDRYNSNESFGGLDLPWIAYHDYKEAPFQNSDSMPLWYFFMMEQLWSTSNTSILYNFLQILKEDAGESWLDEDSIIESICDKVMTLFENENGADRTASFSKITTIEAIEDLAYDVVHHTKDPIANIRNAMLLIHRILKDNYEHRDKIWKFSKEHDLHTRSSFIMSLEDLNVKAEMSIQDFLPYFIKKYVIYRHHFVALRKMTANQSTTKFIREEGLIKYVEGFNFDFSSPRISSLFNFLNDLNLRYYGENELTETGKEFLKQLSS